MDRMTSLLNYLDLLVKLESINPVYSEQIQKVLNALNDDLWVK